MKDETTHLACKPEHAVDLDTGVVVAAPIHPADEGDTTTLSPTLDAAARNLDAVGLAPSEERTLRRGRRQGLSFARTIEGSGRRRVEDAHRRTRAVQGLPALVWRRGGAQSGLRQSRAAEIGYRARDHAPTRRNGRAVLRPCPRSRRHASSMAARTGEPPQALTDPRRRVQSRRPDARPLRSRDAEGGRGGCIRHIRSPIRRGVGFRPDRRHRRRTRSNRHHRRTPDAELKKPGLLQRPALMFAVNGFARSLSVWLCPGA